MKKLWNLLRSMRFGLILLALVAACSVLGSVIPQGRDVAFYAQTYRGAHGVILLLGLHRIFTSWYFAVLLALLCLNLTLCSVVRVRRVAKGGGSPVAEAARLPLTLRLTGTDAGGGGRAADRVVRADGRGALPHLFPAARAGPSGRGGLRRREAGGAARGALPAAPG